MAVHERDLSAAARVRTAAMDAFAARGYAGTSIRDIATAAGVSVGLVQHHFPSKASLRSAVNSEVARLAASAFGPVPEGPASDRIADLATRITTFLQEHPTAFRYLARALTEHDDGAIAVFDAFIEIATDQWQALENDGLLRPDADLVWAPIQIVVHLLGTVLLEHAVSGHLPEPLSSDKGILRWERASTSLFQHGLYQTAQR